VRILGHGPAVEQFVHDQEPYAVAEVKKLGGDGIVGGAQGVAADLLEQFQAPFPGPQGNGRTQAAGIVMEADAFQLEVLAVEPNPVAASNRASRMPNVVRA